MIYLPYKVGFYMKNIIKNNIKVIIAFIIGVVITASISYVVYADSIASSIVTYSRENSEVENVQGALDELYTKSSSIGKTVSLQCDFHDGSVRLYLRANGNVIATSANNIVTGSFTC